MSWFSRKPKQQKYVEAAIAITSNLYLHTIPGTENPPAVLEFGLKDSRYRYMIFCLSAVIVSALGYDEKKQIQPEEFTKGCIYFAQGLALRKPQEYFDDPESVQSSIDHATPRLMEFFRYWSPLVKLENEEKYTEVIDLVSSIIHTTESDQPISQKDKQRLWPLATKIAGQLPAMRATLVELAASRRF
jgi:hypothetical protein